MTEPTTHNDASADPSRRVLFIVGSGRSGTSALACSLQTLGMAVPQPEVPADDSNPRGFGESAWLVDFHDRLLRRCNVRVSDARPGAWFDAGKLATNERVREEAMTWLAAQLTEEGPELVLKDPRLAWFLGLWRSSALRLGVETSHVVMLRSPTEVVGSKQKYYSSRVSEISRSASWVNHLLHTERATRSSARSFVSYHQVLDDWTIPVYQLGERYDLAAVKTATAKDLRRVHELIDPELHRVRTTWDDLDVPKPLRAVMDETWHQLSRLIDPDNDTSATHATLDDLRADYTSLYEEAEAIAQSSVIAAAGKRKRKDAVDPTAETSAPERATQAESLPPPRRGLFARRGGR